MYWTIDVSTYTVEDVYYIRTQLWHEGYIYYTKITHLLPLKATLIVEKA